MTVGEERTFAALQSVPRALDALSRELEEANRHLSSLVTVGYALAVINSKIPSDELPALLRTMRKNFDRTFADGGNAGE